MIIDTCSVAQWLWFCCPCICGCRVIIIAPAITAIFKIGKMGKGEGLRMHEHYPSTSWRRAIQSKTKQRQKALSELYSHHSSICVSLTRTWSGGHPWCQGGRKAGIEMFCDWLNQSWPSPGAGWGEGRGIGNPAGISVTHLLWKAECGLSVVERVCKLKKLLKVRRLVILSQLCQFSLCDLRLVKQLPWVSSCIC